jgi:predicted ATP-grasp superfamily ATP-dependent carboligase
MSEGTDSRLARVLVLGDYRQTVTVVRSLGRAGFEVTLGTDQAKSSTGFSRHVADVWVYDNSSSQRFYNHLEALLRNERPDFVFTVGESQLRRLIEVAPRFEPLSTWVNPDFATVARCFDKRAMYELVPTLGIPSVAWAPFSSVDDWRARARDMGFPVIVKRKDSAGHLLERKALIYKSAEEFEALLTLLHREPDPASLVLQKFATGLRHNCHVAAADGKLIAYFQQKVLRTDEPDDTGIGVAGVSVPPSPELRAHCEALTGALRYTGIGCIQFLVDDRTGSVAFLEFNARMDSTTALPYRMGLDYPLLAIQLAVYRKARASGLSDAERLLPGAHPETYATGVSYHWLHGDFGALLDELRKGKMDAGAMLVRACSMLWLSLRSYHLTFDWRDPLPTMHMFWRKYLKNPLRRRLPIVRPLAR